MGMCHVDLSTKTLASCLLNYRIMPLGVPSQEIEDDSGPSLHNLLSHGTEVSDRL